MRNILLKLFLYVHLVGNAQSSSFIVDVEKVSVVLRAQGISHNKVDDLKATLTPQDGFQRAITLPELIAVLSSSLNTDVSFRRELLNKLFDNNAIAGVY